MEFVKVVDLLKGYLNHMKNEGLIPRVKIIIEVEAEG